MRAVRWREWWAAISFVMLVSAAARADGVTVDTTLTLNFLAGKHDTGTSIDRFDFTPLPLADADVRCGHTSLHLEGLPPLTFSYGGGPGGAQTTQLSIITATVRRSLRGGFFVGAGQTIYDQRTMYPAATGGVTAQASRVTGARFEAGIVRRTFGAATIEYVFAVNPAMRGVERTSLGAPARPEILNPERAVQVDTAINVVVGLKRGALVSGVRYLNYASRYDLRGTPVDGLLADRNVGVMPVLGYRLRL